MKTGWVLALTLAAVAAAQGNKDITGTVFKDLERPRIAVPALKGSADVERVMDTFNATLTDELSDSGVLQVAPASMYPAEIPQRPEDFKAPSLVKAKERGEPPTVVRNGPWMADWSGPPVSVAYLAFGYTAAQDGRLVLRGWLYNVGLPDLSRAQLLGKLYFGTIDAEGAKKVARDFAADILAQFGARSLEGTKIYFTSTRTGHKEIWSMDYDGGNQHQLTNYKSNTSQAAVSPDGKMVAFVSYAKRRPDAPESAQVMIQSTETGKRLPFHNPEAPTNATPEFAPSGLEMLFASSLSGWMQIYTAGIDGNNPRNLSAGRFIDLSPRVNPKTGNDVAFISDRSGSPQLYLMNLEGANVTRLTEGDGDVANPSWSPDGKRLAFCWTRGFEPGTFNIFLMDVASREVLQLTEDAGRREHPSWAPDGLHIVYDSEGPSSTQIYVMLADGKSVHQLTKEGNNSQPFWANSAR